MKRLAILLVCAAFFCCGDDDDPTGPSQTGQIYPMAVGNLWVVEKIEYDSLGNITSSDTVNLTVARDTVFEGETWYLEAEDGNVDNDYCTSRSDGYWRGWPNEYLMFKYPAQAGDQYLSDDLPIVVESISEPVTVPGGTFNCYKYTAHVPLYGITVYSRLCPNIGPVLEELYRERGNGSTYLAARARMLSYDLQ